MGEEAVEYPVEEDNILPFRPRRLGLDGEIKSPDWLSPLKVGTVFVSINYLSKGTADEYTVVYQSEGLTRLDKGDFKLYVVPEVFCKYNTLVRITGKDEDYD